MAIKKSLVQEFDKETKRLLHRKFSQIGQEAATYAKEHGNYRNRTGRLRASNTYELTSRGVKIKNNAPYAKHVEKKGYDVISGAVKYISDKYK